MTAAEYAERLLHLSTLIVGAVHDDGPDVLREAIDRALIVEAPPGVDPVVALVTVLAAQVDPESTAGERLRWVLPVAEGQLCARVPARPKRARRRRPAPAPRPVVRDLDRLVDDVTAGRLPLGELPRALRHVPVARLQAEGMTAAETAARLRCTPRTVERHRARAREAA